MKGRKINIFKLFTCTHMIVYCLTEEKTSHGDVKLLDKLFVYPSPTVKLAFTPRQFLESSVRETKTTERLPAKSRAHDRNSAGGEWSSC